MRAWSFAEILELGPFFALHYTNKIDHCSLSKELKNLIQIVVCGCPILEQTAIVAKIKKKKVSRLDFFPLIEGEVNRSDND